MAKPKDDDLKLAVVPMSPDDAHPPRKGRHKRKSDVLIPALKKLRETPGQWFRLALTESMGNVASMAYFLGKSGEWPGYEFKAKSTDEGAALFARYAPPTSTAEGGAA